MSSAADCTVDCLSTLADAVAARTRKVRNVVGLYLAPPDRALVLCVDEKPQIQAV